jgi:single-strand DNA-binding protein
MANFNKTILVGRLTSDPESKQLGNTTITTFSLAVSDFYNDKAGNKQEDVSYIDIDAFAKKAELIRDHFKKGDHIFVEGRLKQNKWEDADGNKRSKLIVRLDNFEFYGGRKNDNSDENNADEKPAKFNNNNNQSQKKQTRTPF